MKTNFLKKFLTTLLIVAIIFSTLIGQLSYFGSISLSASQSGTDDVIDGNPYIDVEGKNSSNSLILTNQVAGTESANQAAGTESANQAAGTESANQVAGTESSACSNPDVDDPLFKVPEMTIYMQEGEKFFDHYSPDYTEDATDCDSNIKYTISDYGELKKDTSNLPGTYTIMARATDSSKNTTGIDDGLGQNNPDQIINVVVLPTPKMSVTQIGYSTKVNITFSYDESLYPSDSVVQIVATDDLSGLYSMVPVVPGTFTYTYDQKNYNPHTYWIAVYSSASNAWGEVRVNPDLIQPPYITSLSASNVEGSKDIIIDYEISYNDFPNAPTYLEVDGQHYVTLDPNNTTYTYTATDYGQHDIQLYVDYAETEEPLTKSTTINLTPPIASTKPLSYTGYSLSLFEKITLMIQEVIVEILQ